MKGFCAAVAVSLLVAVPAGATQVPVSIVDFAFNPDSINVQPGDSVVWTNNGYYVHTSTSGINGVWDSLWDSGDLSPGASFAHRFTTNGRFPYFCRHHYPAGMTGVVVVGTAGVGDLPGANPAGVASLPNPFRSATTLRFGPAGSGRLEIGIYDVSGQLVRTLAAAPDGSARYRATWDGRDDNGREAPAGIYRCVSRAGSAMLSRLR